MAENHSPSRQPQYIFDKDKDTMLADTEHPIPELGASSTPEEIAQRKILKLKIQNSAEKVLNTTHTASQPQAVLLSEKTSETNTEKDTKPSSFVGQQQEFTKAEDRAISNQNKPDNSLKPIENQSKTKAQEVPQKPTSVPTSNSNLPPPLSSSVTTIFSTTSPLFGTNLFAPKNNLFATNNNPPNPLNIFSNIPSNPIHTDGQVVFGSFKKNNDNTPQKINIFASTPIPPGSTLPIAQKNIFGTTFVFPENQGQQQQPQYQQGQQPSVGLFGNLATEQNNSGEEEDDNNDDEQQELSPEIDESQAQFDFQYNNPLQKIIQKQIIKLRKGTSDILERGSVALERNQINPACPDIFVYRDQIKKVIFTYNIIPKISKAEQINSAKNLKLTFFYKQEEGSYATEIIKVQFKDDKEGEDFLDQIQTSIHK